MEKRKKKPTANENEVINGLGVSFEDAMKVFAQPVTSQERAVTKMRIAPADAKDIDLMLQKVRTTAKLKEVEERFGVPFNDGKTSLKMAFLDENKFTESVSKLLKSGVQEFEI